MARLTEATHQLNPRFAFVPCCYYRQMTPAFVKNYAPYCDGILFPYRDDSTPPGNLQNAGHVKSEVKALRAAVREVHADHPGCVCHGPQPLWAPPRRPTWSR